MSEPNINVITSKKKLLEEIRNYKTDKSLIEYISGMLNIKNLKSKIIVYGKHISIDLKKIDGFILLKEFKKEIIFLDCTFNEDIKIEFNNLIFIVCNFESFIIFLKGGNCKFFNCQINSQRLGLSNLKKVVISRCNFKKEINIYPIRVRGKKVKITNLEFYESTFSKNIEIHNAIKIINLEFWGNTFKKNIEISSFPDERNVISNFNFEKNNLEANCIIEYSDIKKMTLSNLRIPINFEMNIGELKLNQCEISKIRNSGKIRFYKINRFDKKEESFININNSSFGDVEFQSINLKSFEKNYFYENLFYDLKFTNVIWPKRFNLNENCKLNHLMDTYRVLKISAQKNSDHFNTLKFYSNEMAVLDKLYKNKNKFDGDKIILSFNKYTNWFGTDWRLPLFEFIIIGLIFYIILIFSISNNLENIIGNFFVFLNPTHGLFFVKSGNEICNFTYFIDFSFRVIGSLLLYQTIVAFRKYTRKI